MAITASVVILNHNYGRFLGQAIDSALGQTYPAEVVVVDDGSTDDSRQVIAGYGRRVVPVLKDNGGHGSAFNAGFAACSGEVVVFLDADDLLLADMVGRCVAAFEADPSLVRVQTRMEVVDRDLQTTLGLLPHVPGSLPSGDLRHHVLRHRNYGWQPTSANAFAAWALRRLLPMPEEDYRRSAETYLAELTPLLGPVLSLEDVLVRYRMHGTNAFLARGSTTLPWLRWKLDRTVRNHERVRSLAAEEGLECASDPFALRDAALAGYRLALAAAGDQPGERQALGRRLRLAARAVAVTARHPSLGVAARAKRIGWFLAVSAAPPTVAVRLVEAWLPDGPRRRHLRLPPEGAATGDPARRAGPS